MIILVYEDAANIMYPIIGKFTNRYKESSRFYLSSKTTSVEMKVLGKPPLFNSGWLVVCAVNTRLEKIVEADRYGEKNIILVRVTSKSELAQRTAEFDLKKIKYRFINNKVEKEQVCQWITEQTGLDLANAELIWKRCGGYLKNVIVCTQSLKVLPTIRRSDILRYSRTPKFAVYDLAVFILRVHEKKMTKEDAVGVIYLYRYRLDSLKKYLLSEFNTVAKVFLAISDGVLSLESYQQYDGDVDIRMMHPYRLKKMIGWYRVLSFEYLYYCIGCVEVAKDTIDYINLVEVGGS